MDPIDFRTYLLSTWDTVFKVNMIAGALGVGMVYVLRRVWK